MRNAGLEETQAGIKIASRNINNLRYADDTTLMAESEEELKSLLMYPKAFAKLQGHLWASCFPHFSESFLKKKKNKKQIKKKKQEKPRTFLRTMPQWKEHRPSILRPKFAKNLELGVLFCFVLFESNHHII